MKLIAKIIIVAAIFYIGFYFGSQQALAPTNGSPDAIEQTQGEQIQVSLMLDFGNGQIRTFDTNLEENTSVFNLLEKITSENDLGLGSKDYGELGAFVESIGDIKNDVSGDRFWQYWINNQYAEVGASLYQLKTSDIIEWKFTKGQFN